MLHYRGRGHPGLLNDHFDQVSRMNMNIRIGLFVVVMAIAMIAPPPAGSYGAEVTANLTVDKCKGAGIPIWITVEKVRSARGTIKVELYDNIREEFLKKGGKVDRTRVAARKGETRLCLDAPSSGKYSIALYHDENGNRKFDQNFLGIPQEGFGFSNNPELRFGLPKQEEMLFEVDAKPKTLRISVIYLWD